MEGEKEMSHPLREAREARNLSMRHLATRIGLGKSGHNRVFEWEHGQHIPTLFVANALAPLLGFESGTDLRERCITWQREKRLPVVEP